LTKTPLKNIAASVRQRLLNKSRSDIRPFQELVQYYTMERFLYRLSLSRHSNRFILKGALMLIWLLSRQFGFDGKTLPEVIMLTLEQRETELPNEIVAFSQEFIKSKKIQWNAFSKKLQQDHVPIEFENIVMKVIEFIDPIVSALASRKPPPSRWSASGPWV